MNGKDASFWVSRSDVANRKCICERRTQKKRLSPSFIEEFKKTYDAADPPAIVKLFAPDSIFLGTTMQKPTRDKEAILKYFQASASANLPKHVEIENYEALQVSESAMLFSGQNVFFKHEMEKKFQRLIHHVSDHQRVKHRPLPFAKSTRSPIVLR